MSRWKVHRTTDEISPWAAVYDGWEGNRLALRKAHHGTWVEAMAYADRMSRTVEVTLPRSPNQNTGTMTTHTSGNGILLTLKTPTTPIQARITHTELKPLALALLAQHYAGEGA